MKTDNIAFASAAAWISAASIFCLIHHCTGCGCLYTFTYRARLRQKFELPEEPCGDLCVDCCCLGCSICQVYRELKNRGINPILGWQGVQAIYEFPGQPPQNVYQEVQLSPGPPKFDEPQAPPKHVAEEQPFMTGPPQGYPQPSAPVYNPPGQQFMAQRPPPPQ